MNEIALIGESVYMESMAYSLSAVLGVATKVICPLETSKALVDSPDVQEPYEDGIAAQLKDVCVVIADPLYKPLIPLGLCLFHYRISAFPDVVLKNRFLIW